ncbi:MAG: MauE/DoxX family redox-associated membrane protein [Opitutales bacterium]|jgi:uncharacterized membrane protein YphA (DoxX/SURF4 family)
MERIAVKDAAIMEWVQRRAAPLLAAAVLGAVFLAAGVTKAQDVAGFFRAVQDYRVFPHALALGLAYFVPALELVAGAAVLSTRWRRAGALVLGALLAAFLILLAVSWARGLDITCGCFGEGAGPANYPLRLGRDAVLLALAVVVFRWSTPASEPAARTP